MEILSSTRFVSNWTAIGKQEPRLSSSPLTGEGCSRARIWERDSRAMTWQRDSRSMTWQRDSRAMTWQRDSRAITWQRDSRAMTWQRDSRGMMWQVDSRAVAWSGDKKAAAWNMNSRRGVGESNQRLVARQLRSERKTGSYDWFHKIHKIQSPTFVDPSSCQAGKRSHLSISASDDTQGEGSSGPVRRREALKELDKLLEGKEDREAVGLLVSLKGRVGGIRAFGAATQVPLRPYTIEDLRLNKIEPALLLSPQDKTLGAVRRNAFIAAVLGFGSVVYFLQLEQSQILATAVAILFIGTADQIGNGGGGEALLIDTFGRLFSERYRQRVAQHEAGHFLVSYLLGTLPRGYTLSSADALLRYGAQNVQAGTQFVDYDFQEEVAGGTLSSKMLDRVSCIALAGVAVEYLQFGSAEGGLSDILQLDGVMRSIGFTQKKADFQVRWSVLNTISILRRHKKVLLALSAYMSASKSVGECVDLIETELEGVEDL